MLIYAVADIHGRTERLAVIKSNIAEFQPDALVMAGDITRWGYNDSFLAQLFDMPLPVLMVRGNTDAKKLETQLQSFPHVTSLHLQEISLGGIPFVGLSGTIPVPFRSRISLREKHVLKILEGMIRPHSVMVTHSPPRGILDGVLGRFPAGSQNLHETILRAPPALLICGHIHESAGITSVGKTVVVNAAMSRHHNGALITYDGERVPQVRILKQ